MCVATFKLSPAYEFLPIDLVRDEPFPRKCKYPRCLSLYRELVTLHCSFLATSLTKLTWKVASFWLCSFPFHNCVCHAEISLDLHPHPLHFGRVPSKKKRNKNKTKTNTGNYKQALNSVKWDDAKNYLTKKAKIPDWSSYFPAVCLRDLNSKHKWGGRGGGYRIFPLP